MPATPTPAAETPAPTAGAPASGVLHLLPHQGVWGTGRLVLELARHERMDGGRDEIVLTERPLDVNHDFMAAATPVHALGFGLSRPGQRATRVRDLVEGRGLRALRAYTSGDLVLGAAAVKSRARLPEHVPLEGLLMEPPRADGFLARRRLRAAARAADPLRCASPALARAWAPVLGTVPEVVRPGVDVGRYSPGGRSNTWRDARLPSRDTLLIGSLMRAAPTKQHGVLIEAVRRRNAAGHATALLLIGDGPEHGARRALRSPEDFIFVRKRVNDSPGFFRNIDALALHAMDESVPMTLLEAMAVGCPAMVADRGDVAELVGQDAALFTEPGDVDAAVEALDRLADANERVALGEAARKRALAQHSLGAMRKALAPRRGARSISGT